LSAAVNGGILCASAARASPSLCGCLDIGPLQGGVTKRLIRLFTLLAQGRWLVAAQDPVRLSDDSEPEPDLTLLRPAPDDYTSQHPGPEDVLLLVEVADASLPYDRSEKLPAYGRAGIAEAWIVNLPEQAIEIYREPHFGGYGFTAVVRAGQSASPGAFPHVQVSVSELFRRG
jgi:Uma2 family endonuclease